ncbi:hypothetical protein CEF21_15015 [Bacillus sp. FJAT-42376]|uniref:hypothetical protein n=1 Tax=Bacillus sp. FJAT-42376 TaxID=2014076 RepID=UPI000F4E86FB|nr:hypothetical protein [Bacillus sp. FJAT-42376]AZB43506.1 hypothetical protein CEF21_15015 [Bacillus sp. FJAT-42376]
MSKYQEMLTHFSMLREVSESTGTFVTTVRDLYKEECGKIESNSDLSEHGKLKKKEALQKDFGEAFIRNARKLKEERNLSAVKTRTAAEMIMNEKPKKPSEIAVKSFERKLSELKMDIMLESRPESALSKIQSFAKEITDPYLSDQIIENFPSLAQSVIQIAGSNPAKYKSELHAVLSESRSKAISPEQKKAAELFDIAGDNFGRDLFFPQGMEMTLIKQTFGPRIAEYANRPEFYELEEEKQARLAKQESE